MLKIFFPSASSVKGILCDALFHSSYLFRKVATAQNTNASVDNRKLVQITLQKLLKIRPILAVGIILSNKKFSDINPDILSTNYELCKNENVTTETILKCPVILLQTGLSNKIEKIKEIPINLNSTIFLSLLSMNRLEYFINSMEGPVWRIEKMCKTFSISEGYVCELLAKKTFLLCIDFDHLESNLKLFEGIGISKENLLKDMWIFRYSERFILNRFKIFKEHGIKDIKTWMIRCPEITLYKHIQKETENRKILGDNSAAEYLSFKLNCSESVVNFIIDKHKQLKTTNISKLSETIDFLYKYGYTSEQICRVPKILLHSTKTTENRIKQLIDLGIGLRQINLYILTKSKKQYMQHVEAVLKNKTKT